MLYNIKNLSKKVYSKNAKSDKFGDHLQKYYMRPTFEGFFWSNFLTRQKNDLKILLMCSIQFLIVAYQGLVELLESLDPPPLDSAT